MVGFYQLGIPSGRVRCSMSMRGNRAGMGGRTSAIEDMGDHGVGAGPGMYSSGPGEGRDACTVRGIAEGGAY